jgi:hypothetical protein
MTDRSHHDIGAAQFKDHSVVPSPKPKASSATFEGQNITCTGKCESVDRVEYALTHHAVESSTLLFGAGEKKDAERGHDP